MSNYVEGLKEQRERLYYLLKLRYTEEEKLSPKGFTDLLDLIYVDLEADLQYQDTVAILLKLRVQKRPRISCINSLLKRDDLWQALNYLDIHPGYFILTCADYIVREGHLNYDLNSHVSNEWDFESDCQQLFNFRVNEILDTLKVFYD